MQLLHVLIYKWDILLSAAVFTELISEWPAPCEDTQFGLKQAAFSLDHDEYRHEACLER